VNIRVLSVSILLACLTLPVSAGSPPLKSKVTPESVTASCLALGAQGEVIAKGAGCRNTDTGAAVTCSGTQCTDYFADPRYKKIKGILDAGKIAPQKAPIRL
jgi:hypothetical protein